MTLLDQNLAIMGIRERRAQQRRAEIPNRLDEAPALIANAVAKKDWIGAAALAVEAYELSKAKAETKASASLA